MQLKKDSKENLSFSCVFQKRREAEKLKIWAFRQQSKTKEILKGDSKNSSKIESTHITERFFVKLVELTNS